MENFKSNSALFTPKKQLQDLDKITGVSEAQKNKNGANQENPKEISLFGPPGETQLKLLKD